MKIISKNNSNVIDYIFASLWIVALLPKYFQFIFFLLIILYEIRICEFKLIIRTESFFLLMFCFIHLVSIIFALYDNFDVSRLFAALNSLGMWVLSILQYNIVIDYYEINIKKISKICFFNLLIMLFLVLVMLFVSIVNKYNSFYLFNNILYTTEWLSSGTKIRFYGLLEYSNLVVYYFILLFPFALLYLKETSKFLRYLFSLSFPLIVFFTNSRVGYLIFAFSLIYPIFYFNFVGKKNKIIFKYFIVLLLVIFLINYRTLYELFMNIVMLRIGSTSARSNVYMMSIKKAFFESPLIGCGIKYLYNNLPLGSHSTYIGVFYKTGFLGTIFFLIGFLKHIIVVKNNKIAGNFFFYFCFIILFMIFEDIDGANWIIFIFFTIMGMYSSEEVRNYVNKN